jgi:coenzyme F420-dependent glucose-6-phosphate dehydrogenase
MVLLGWNVPSEQYDTFDILDPAVAAEKVGFESISASDHFHPRDPLGQSCNIWTWLDAAASRLNGMEIDTGVTCPILSYYPAILPQSAATIDRIKKGSIIRERNRPIAASTA